MILDTVGMFDAVAALPEQWTGPEPATVTKAREVRLAMEGLDQQRGRSG